MSRGLRYGKRFSGTGIGQTPTIDEIYGLTKPQRMKRIRISNRKIYLKAKALEGHAWAKVQLTRLTLAGAKGQRTKAGLVPTKVHLSFMDRDVPEKEDK
jgi:hypothetical protein